MLRHSCGFLLGVLLIPDVFGVSDKRADNSADLGKAHDVVKRSSDLDTETKGRYDPCSISWHIEINNYKRSLQIQATDAETLIDDGEIPYFWYRFTSGVGGEIPTSCPAAGQCNTLHPIWMKGTIPPDDDEAHTVQMCVNDNVDPKCEYKCQDALIKNCTEYLVYKLRPSPTKYAAYCAGNGNKCSTGENSPTGFTPCEKEENIQDVPKPPIVDLDDSDPLYFYGRCTLTDPDPTVEHDVRWKAGGNIFHRQTLLRGETVARVSELDMYFRNRTIVGYNLTCEVSARKLGFDIGSAYTKSSGDGYYLGLKIFNEAGNEIRTLVIREDGVEQAVYLKPTFPIRCNSEYYKEGMTNELLDYCHVKTRVVNGDVNELAEQLRGDCGAETDGNVAKVAEQIEFGECLTKMKPTTWNNHLSHKVIVHAVQDKVFDGIQVRYIEFQVDGADQPLWEGYTPPYLKVQISDSLIPRKDLSTCTLYNGHMTSFDGKKYDNNNETGEFVLYESTVYNIRVHAYFIKCGKFSCNCGVVAQAGDDVIIFDKCKKFGDIIQGVDDDAKDLGIIRTRVLPTGEMTQGFTIGRETSTDVYKIKFPHGAELTIYDRSGQLINLAMSPSQSDYSETGEPIKVRGLCGTYNKNPDDDYLKADGQQTGENARFPTNSNNAWHIPKGDPKSLYSGQLFDLTDNPGPHKYCACLRKSERDGTKKASIQCAFGEECRSLEDLTGVLEKRSTNRRRKRSIGHDDVEDFDDSLFVFDPPTEPFVNEPQWPAAGMNKRQTREFCNREFEESAAAQGCKDIADVNREEDIEMCIKDIGLSNSTMFVSSALLRNSDKCKEKITTDMSFWKINDKLNLVDPPRVAENQESDIDKIDLGGIVGASATAKSVDPALRRPIMKIQAGMGSGVEDLISSGKSYLPDPSIIGALCPNACFGRGTCHDGKCSCNEGFIGNDCSGSSDAPKVYHIPQQGLCDIQTRPCQRTPVMGFEFVEYSSLRCHFQELDPVEGGFIETGRTHVTIPQFETKIQIHCPLPEAGRRRRAVEGAHHIQAYNVGVSNLNGEFGRTKKLVVYDSECQTCSTTEGCQIKDNWCIIDGKCVANDVRNDSNSCLACRSRYEQRQWSPVSC